MIKELSYPIIMTQRKQVMKTDLKDYVVRYDRVLQPEFCFNCIKNLQNKNFTQHKFYNPTSKDYKPRSGSKELDITWDNIPEVSLIHEKLAELSTTYVRSFNFPWFQTIHQFTNVRFNKYSTSRLMAPHNDHIHSIFDGERKGIPIISMLGMLNEDYEGGEFVMFDDEVINLNQGDILIFPSIFLFPHKVNPVTKGTRYSFISWGF